ncbi:uncharacterized protein LOC123315683 [Coccinella septempunctata]|uniref:uncharacterized protein LOC123315683 n=1 Tax=Coccinella septempunctata TaxID=41139 RepID=UPI001D086243|nr:uncharacterized protein LOC123315683 [Coccinella septempunctata]
MKSILLSIFFLVLICYVNSAKLGVTETNNEVCEKNNLTSWAKFRFKNTKSFGPYALCLLKHNDIISEDGQIQKEVVMSRVVKVIGLGSKDVEEVVECAIQKNDAGETAIYFFNCAETLLNKIDCLEKLHIKDFNVRDRFLVDSRCWMHLLPELQSVV